MKEKKASRLKAGDRVSFIPARGGNKRLGTVEKDGRLGKMVSVRLDGDPFPVYTEYRQIKLISQEGGHSMPETTNEPTNRELRVQCKEANIEGWQTMDRSEMERALKTTGAAETSAAKDKEKPVSKPKAPAKKAAAKTTKATKATAKKAAAKGKSTAKKAAAKPAEPRQVAKNGNPFREGTNMWFLTESLLKGGKRSKQVAALRKKVDVTPRDGSTLKGEELDAQIDRRLQICAQILEREHGFEKVKEGRGSDATLKVVAPK